MSTLKRPAAPTPRSSRPFHTRTYATLSSWSSACSSASPRGYCAGVERAVDTVELALEHYGAPIYVRKQIVHNAHVVRELEERGAIFVDSEEEAPEGATIVFSAHGVAPVVHTNAAARGLNTIDATCPLVTKVHAQARRFAAEGYTVLLIGHAGHEEVEGTMGEAPEATVLIESVAGRRDARLPRRCEARVHHADDALGRRDRRDHQGARGGASRTCTHRSGKTSVTRRPTGSGPSRRCSARSSSCS